MASRPASSAPALPLDSRRESGAAAGAIVLAATIPFIFFHGRYLPTLSVGVGSTAVDATTADLAVAVVAITALWVAWRHGARAQLRAGLPLWLSMALLLTWIAIETVRGAGTDGSAAHAVTAAKYAEYTLLALAVPVLVRRADDLVPLLWALSAWSCVAAGVALMQFTGVPVFDAWKAGWRQPSFIGHHDLAALSGLAAAIGVTSLAIGRRWPYSRRLGATALAGGVLGLVLAGSVAATGGFVLGSAALVLLVWRRFGITRRRALEVAATATIVCAGVIALRADPLASFLGFLGVRDDTPATGIETYSQRTVLSYIGLRIFLDHPVIGVGWQRSALPEAFGPYLDDARRRFPDVVEEALPAPGREWGVQNAYLQSAADMGIVGLCLFLSVFVAGLTLAVRAVLRASDAWARAAVTSITAITVVMGLWTALGIVAGIPLDAATWLSLGLAAACLAQAPDAVTEHGQSFG